MKLKNLLSADVGVRLIGCYYPRHHFDTPHNRPEGLTIFPQTNNRF